MREIGTGGRHGPTEGIERRGTAGTARLDVQGRRVLWTTARSPANCIGWDFARLPSGWSIDNQQTWRESARRAAEADERDQSNEIGAFLLDEMLRDD
jgi:hypothetical protein